MKMGEKRRACDGLIFTEPLPKCMYIRLDQPHSIGVLKFNQKSVITPTL